MTTFPTGVSGSDGATSGFAVGASEPAGEDVFRRFRSLYSSEVDEVDGLSRGRGGAGALGEVGDCVTGGGEENRDPTLLLALPIVLPALLKKAPKGVCFPLSLFAGVSDIFFVVCILLGGQK